MQSASWGPLSFSLTLSWQRSVHEVGSRRWGQPFNLGQLHQVPSLFPTPAFLGETIPLNVRAPDFQEKQSPQSLSDAYSEGKDGEGEEREAEGRYIKKGEGTAWGDLQVDHGSVLEKSPSTAQHPPIFHMLTGSRFCRSLGVPGPEWGPTGPHSEPGRGLRAPWPLTSPLLSLSSLRSGSLMAGVVLHLSVIYPGQHLPGMGPVLRKCASMKVQPHRPEIIHLRALDTGHDLGARVLRISRHPEPRPRGQQGVLAEE